MCPDSVFTVDFIPTQPINLHTLRVKQTEHLSELHPAVCPPPAASQVVVQREGVGPVVTSQQTHSALGSWSAVWALV